METVLNPKKGLLKNHNTITSQMREARRYLDFFLKRIKNKKQHHAQCEKHDAVLNREGFYDKNLSVHSFSEEIYTRIARGATFLLTVQKPFCKFRDIVCP